MKVKFKCKTTGCVYEFEAPHDIADMRRHTEYEEVIEEVKKVKETKPKK